VAFLRHPRSWNRISETLSPFSILEDASSHRYRPLSPNEACSLLFLTIEEASSGELKTKLIEKRLPFVSYLASHSSSVQKAMALFLSSHFFEGGILTKDSSPRVITSQYLLLQLYLLDPEILSLLSFPGSIHDLVRSHSSVLGNELKLSLTPFNEFTGKNESTLHRLLIKMFDTTSETSKSKAKAAYTACRRLASLHPISVLRFLSFLFKIHLAQLITEISDTFPRLLSY